MPLLFCITGCHEQLCFASSSLQSSVQTCIKACCKRVIRLAAAVLIVDFTGPAKTSIVSSTITAGCDQSCGAANIMLFTDISNHVQLCTSKSHTSENTCRFKKTFKLHFARREKLRFKLNVLVSIWRKHRFHVDVKECLNCFLPKLFVRENQSAEIKDLCPYSVITLALIC